MGMSSKRLLKLLSNVGTELSFNDLLTMSGLSPSTLRKYIKELVEMGYIVEKNGRYVISEKAKLVLEGEKLGHKIVSRDAAYLFTDEKGLPLPLMIDSVEKLYIAVKYGFVSPEIVVEHIARGYLTKRLSEALGAHILAKHISNTKNIEEILKILEEYIEYHVQATR